MLAWLDWLAALSAPLLYGAIALAAFAENIFPPLPADTVVALGAFVAARGDGSAWGAWIATMVGNLAGAMTMFVVGRRVGMRWLSTRYPKIFPPDAATRIARDFAKRGIVAIAVSRFVPGVRALVPPVAGALGMGAFRSALAMTVASAVWYGVVCALAFRAGANAEILLSRIAAQQRWFGVGAAVAVVVGVAFHLVRRTRGHSS